MPTPPQHALRESSSVRNTSNIWSFLKANCRCSCSAACQARSAWFTAVTLQSCAALQAGPCFQGALSTRMPLPGLCEQHVLALPAPAPAVTLVPRRGSGPKAPPASCCSASRGARQPGGSQQDPPNLRGVTFKNLSPQAPRAELKQGQDHGKCRLA